MHLQHLGSVATPHAGHGSKPASGSGVGSVAAPQNIASMADTQKPKRARTSKPKVKTGCNNCKQRRIKCDERRPACMNCVRSKKQCTGYPPPPRQSCRNITIAPKPVIISANNASAPPPPGREPIHLPPRRVSHSPRHMTPPQTPAVQHTTTVTMYRPSSKLDFSELEGLYFQLFQERTANELSGFFDSVFWSRTVLQECHAESSIRHAVVALGALYKTLEKTSESPPGSPTSDGHHHMDGALRHWEVAVKQYHNALGALGAVNSADSKSHRTRLMASVLLACFDSFIGDHKQAIVQIQSGVSLLEKLRAERRNAFLPPKPEEGQEPVEEELVQMFRRLAIQAKSYDMAFHFPHPWVIRLTKSGQAQAQGIEPETPPPDYAASPSPSEDLNLPERFGSLLEARVAWDALCERIFRFTETMFTHTQTTKTMVLPAHMSRYGMTYKKEIEDWAAAFEHILAARTAPGTTSQEKAGIAVLKNFQIMGQILLLMTFSSSEMEFDRFQPLFQTIVNLAQEVVGDEERRAAMRRCPDPRLCQHHGRRDHVHDPPSANGSGRFGSPLLPVDIFGGYEYAAHHIKPSFSADMGIVPPLFVVATKCRNPITRRQAIQLLLSSSRREGMWDSELAARIGLWIAQVEENDDGETQSQDLSQAQIPTLLTPTASPDSPLPYNGAGNMTSRPSTAGSVVNGPSAAQQQYQRQATPPSYTIRSGSADYGDTALGPGGNARWDTRRESLASINTAVNSHGGGQYNNNNSNNINGGTGIRRFQQMRNPPEEKRVMVRTVEFDLRERYALVRLGTRGLYLGAPDARTQSKRITW